jgi:hypothetical protein
MRLLVSLLLVINVLGVASPKEPVPRDIIVG